MDAPLLDGIHHVKVPVTDLDRSRDWYASRLGYEVDAVFVEGGREMGVVMSHPNGGPGIGLRLDPQRSEGIGDFDFFSIGVPDRPALDDLAARLSDLGERHAGVHFATIGWILPMLHDPDGHEVRFYTTDHHTDLPRGQATRIENPRESAQAREAELRAQSAHR
jgi:catechol 2,3-dioxygenase-like lactoylglutathione lyase family enzyme